MEEIWLPLVGHEGSHEISSLGRIKSLSRKVRTIKYGQESFRLKKEKILKQYTAKTGYCYIQLTNKGKTFTIHRLVAKTFIQNPLHKPCVNHLNGIKTDNRVSNLEWSTYSENEQHSYNVLNKKPTSLGRIPSEKTRAIWRSQRRGIPRPEKRKRIIAFKNGIEVGVYQSIKDAGVALGISRQSVSMGATENKLIKGYEFRLS